MRRLSTRCICAYCLHTESTRLMAIIVSSTVSFVSGTNSVTALLINWGVLIINRHMYILQTAYATGKVFLTTFLDSRTILFQKKLLQRRHFHKCWNCRFWVYKLPVFPGLTRLILFLHSFLPSDPTPLQTGMQALCEGSVFLVLKSRLWGPERPRTYPGAST